MNDNKEEERKAKARERAAKRAVLRREESIAKEAKKAKPPEQKHRLKNGEVVTISRDGNHKYKLNGGSPMSNVSSFIRYTNDKDLYKIGGYTAIKKARENDGDLTAWARISAEELEIGNNLHAAINDFIRYGEMSEDPLFVAWYDKIGKKHKWLVSEQFVVDPRLRYGGTVDALSEEDTGVCLWDWKTKNSETFDKYGPPEEDQIQVEAYMAAYRAMGSEFLPTTGMICYIMRDTHEVKEKRVESPAALECFRLAVQMDNQKKILRSGG